jgi:hypothetical protein
MSNIAQGIKAYYDHKDFKDNYAYCLAESFSNNKGDILNRILDLFNVSNYETEKYLSNWQVINRDQAKKIFDFIDENFELFTKDFSSYWVGSTSLESVSFGEQEEQLTGLHNHKTGKDYSLPYLRKVFDKEGYYVKDNYAYYDLSSHGLHIDLLAGKGKDLLNDFLLTIKQPETITE